MPGRYLDITGNDLFNSNNFLNTDFGTTNNYISSSQFNFDFGYDVSIPTQSTDSSMNTDYDMYPTTCDTLIQSPFDESECTFTQTTVSVSPTSCPTSLCDEEDSHEEVSVPTLVAKRKRGRPRKQPGEKTLKTPSNRIPHTDVERKYRNGLNHQLEQLRLHVPTLSLFDAGCALNSAKPGKLAVLAAAVEYIKQVESQMKRLGEENEELRRLPHNMNSRTLAGAGSRQRKKEKKTEKC